MRPKSANMWEKVGERVSQIKTSESTSTLDDASTVCWSIDGIIDVLRETVDILEAMKTVYNSKVSDEEVKRNSEGQQFIGL